MMEPTGRDDLLAIERERWASLEGLLDSVPEARASEPSLNPEGWSVRDLVWHLACWNDVVAAELEKMQMGTFDDGFDWETEQNNTAFLVSGRSIGFAEAMARLARSRRDLVNAMEALQEVTPRAVELFSEPAYRHIDDHVPELRRFVASDLPT